MKKIGIVIAMEEEFQAIENKIKEIKVHEEKGLKFFEGKIGEKECVIVKSGVGKVNAARTTQAMIDNFDIEYIINMGASGSIANDLLNIGDVVIANNVVQHDFDITAFWS
ncbi:MAG: 5'-methylthioadenosine/S-adenosylhomocysteine nucleosidase [Clostridia bacterium]